MQLEWGPEEEAFRAELAEFLDANAPAEAKGRDFAQSNQGESEVGFPPWAREWQACLFDNGWLVPGYPPELGGRNATPVQTLVYIEEMAARGLPRSLHFPGWAIVAPSLLEFGTDEQKALAPAALRGDTVWCIGMSEPGAGSDLAGLTTRAERHGDTFVVNGQKVWTSYAQWAQKCLCYVRTDGRASRSEGEAERSARPARDTEVPKHKGISVLIIDMDTPGIDPRPLKQITGNSEFAEVFFTDVQVPAKNLVGAMNDGWRITMGSLAHERGGLWVTGVSQLDHLFRGLMAIARHTGKDRDPVVRRRLAQAYELVSSFRSLGYKGFATLQHTSSSPEHSYLKLATSETGKAMFELGIELEGAAGVVLDKTVVPDAGRWIHGLFAAFANTIAGGTSEIQRNIIAERVLGLPRG